MRTKGKKETIKPNCRYCRHAGPVRNFACWCEVLQRGRATGIRACQTFEVDNEKHLAYAATQRKTN